MELTKPQTHSNVCPRAVYSGVSIASGLPSNICLPHNGCTNLHFDAGELVSQVEAIFTVSLSRQIENVSMFDHNFLHQQNNNDEGGTLALSFVYFDSGESGN
jgi:hypothetical protein